MVRMNVKRVDMKLIVHNMGMHWNQCMRIVNLNLHAGVHGERDGLNLHEVRLPMGMESLTLLNLVP